MYGIRLTRRFFYDRWWKTIRRRRSDEGDNCWDKEYILRRITLDEFGDCLYDDDGLLKSSLIFPTDDFLTCSFHSGILIKYNSPHFGLISWSSDSSIICYTFICLLRPNCEFPRGKSEI